MFFPRSAMEYSEYCAIILYIEYFVLYCDLHWRTNDIIGNGLYFTEHNMQYLYLSFGISYWEQFLNDFARFFHHLEYFSYKVAHSFDILSRSLRVPMILWCMNCAWNEIVNLLQACF